MKGISAEIKDDINQTLTPLGIDDDEVGFWECSDYGIFVLLSERFYKTLNYRSADPEDFISRLKEKNLPFKGSYADSRLYLREIISHLSSFGLSPSIFDVGGYIGRFSIESALLCRDENLNLPIVCLEPGMTRGIIKANLDVNNVKDLVDLRALAASDKAGSADYKYALDVLISGRICEFPSASESKSVETVRLDQLLSSVDQLNSAILKIDTEGHEADVLTGLGDYATSLPHVCVIEFWPASLTQKVNGVPYANFIHENYSVLNIRSSLYPAYFTEIHDITLFGDEFNEAEGNVDLLFVSKSIPEHNQLITKLKSFADK